MKRIKHILLIIILVMIFMGCQSAPRYELIKQKTDEGNISIELKEIETSGNGNIVVVTGFTLWGMAIGITSLLVLDEYEVIAF